MLTTEEKKRFVSLRQQIIGDRYRNLNEPQRQAVMTTAGPLLLLAGAGSGKTTVLIERIANLINFGQGSDSFEVDDGVSAEDLARLEACVAGQEGNYGEVLRICAHRPVAPWNILAITFTNKAAGELKERLERSLGAMARDVWAFTFHSACVRILRRDIDKLGYATKFTIYDTADSLSAIKMCLKELEMSEKDFPPRAILGEISRAKDKMLLAKEYAVDAEASNDYYAKIVARVYKKYEKKLKDAEALDFDDIILQTVRLFEKNPDVLAYYHDKFHYVLIDEYQDTNQVQYRLASLLAKGRENFCVVGDDDQSIYRFRGATIENIMNFEKQYTKAKVIRLEENYRSTQNILDASNQVIQNNHGRKGKKLWTQAEKGDLLTFHTAGNESEEAQYICDKMMENYSGGTAWREHVILYRANAQSNQLENACKRMGIPYRILGGTRFFDRAEVKDMLAYLTVLSNPEDDLRLLRIINNPPRGIGDKTVQIAQEIALRDDTCLFAVVDNASIYPELQKSVKKLEVFARLMGELAVLAQEMTLPEFYETLLQRSGYVAMLEEKNLVENQTRLENVRELLTSINGYVEGADEENPATLEGFLDEIALFTNLDTHDASQDFVTMMTMHSAKGLEFPVVLLPGMEEGIFPSYRVVGDQVELEEERRLCYVAMTRAKQKLYLTSATQRMLYGRTSYNKTSRFVLEIPSELLNETSPVPSLGDAAIESSVANTGKYHAPSFSKGRTVSAPEPKLEGFLVGDVVTHKAFGRGTVSEITPLPGDALLTVEFENIGSKRLMLKAVRSFLKKES